MTPSLQSVMRIVTPRSGLFRIREEHFEPVGLQPKNATMGRMFNLSGLRAIGISYPSGNHSFSSLGLGISLFRFGAPMTT